MHCKTHFVSEYLPRFFVLPLAVASLWCPSLANAVSFDVYILTGQSNSLGTTNLEGANFRPGDDPLDAATSFFWSNVTSSNTRFPATLYGDSGGAITTLQPQQGDNNANPMFWGPEFGLARQLAPSPGSELLIIKASRGGGGNTFWDAEAFDTNPNTGHMWGHVRDTIDAALEEVQQAGDSYDIRGLMYMQGESNNGAEAAEAGERLASFIDNVAGHLNDNYDNAARDLHTAVFEIAASQSSANRRVTTDAHIALAESRGDVSFIPTRDLPLKSDNIHFGREAKLEIGNRAATLFATFLQQPNGISGDVNQDGVLSGTGLGHPDVDDISAFRAGWLAVTNGLSPLEKTKLGDFDLSGRTDLADVFILHAALEQAGFQISLAAIVAPEPRSWQIGLTVLLGLAAGRRRGILWSGDKLL